MKRIIWLSFVLIVVCIAFVTAINFCSDAAKTVEKELKPSALLKKYEWFKNQSAAIDKKRADIELYRTEIETFEVTDKDDKIYIQQRKTELIGIISIHNSLCSEYNAQMVKINYAFCNVGDLPATNLEVLPKEYKPYINNLNK